MRVRRRLFTYFRPTVSLVVVGRGLGRRLVLDVDVDGVVYDRWVGNLGFDPEERC